MAHPKSLHQTKRLAFSQKWCHTHDGFIDRCIELGTWKFVSATSSSRPLLHLWAYRYKTNPQGAITGFSARCTARGDIMKPKVHFNPTQTSAQIPSRTARRLLYANAALNGGNILLIDVEGAYPRAPTEKRYRVIMKQPKRSDEQYTVPGKHILLCNVQSGAPDSGFRWELHRNNSLKKWGWTQLTNEPSTFIFTDHKLGNVTRLLAATDDFILTATSHQLIDVKLRPPKRHWIHNAQRYICHELV